MATQPAIDAQLFTFFAAIPVVLMGLYAIKSNPRENANRVFSAFAVVWGLWTGFQALVPLSGDLEQAIFFAEASAFTAVLLVTLALHFVLTFPYHSSLLGRSWVLPALYFAMVLMWFAMALGRTDLIPTTTVDPATGDFTAPTRGATQLLIVVGFILTTLILILRYTLTDFPLTRRRAFLLTFGMANFTLFYAFSVLPLDATMVQSTDPGDQQFGRLNFAAAALLLLTYFSIAILLALRTSDVDRSRECWTLILSGLAATFTGLLDTPIREAWPLYPGGLAAWQLVAATLAAFALLRYQLPDADRRSNTFVQYGTVIVAFLLVFLLVQGILDNFFRIAYAYPIAGAVSALLVAGVPGVRSLIRTFARTAAPPLAAPESARERALEVYRAALEGALSDYTFAPIEQRELMKLRRRLGLSDEEHRQMEREIRTGGARGTP